MMVCRGRYPMLLPSAKYTEWHESASWQLKKHIRRIAMFPKSKITLIFIAGDNYKFDLTNKAESVMDLLVDNGFIVDDNYVSIPEIVLKFGGVEKGNHSVKIKIEEYE